MPALPFNFEVNKDLHLTHQSNILPLYELQIVKKFSFPTASHGSGSYNPVAQPKVNITAVGGSVAVLQMLWATPKMDLTEQHINFELDARLMFIGQTIRGVVYGELEYIDEEGNNVDPEPYFKTKYPDLDTLDYSVYFKTDIKTIYVTWDNAFVSYGLSSKYKDLNDNSGTYVQKWDVSNEPKWRDLVGQKIVDFNVYWSEIWTSNPDGNYKISTPYPQSFIITTEGKNKTSR